uniref:RNA-binding protein 28 n=1 Tax=Cacopsylla melanoneura TaxID=428564 RepID=A0A8D8R9P3_9HEMI
MEKLNKKKKIKKVFKKKNEKKVERQKPDKTKRGRIFVKNLPFKITEQELKDHFSQYGDIVDFQLLKNSDGKLKGCGFINYDKKISAVKAILKCNKKPFKDRTISVDWAVPKSTFEKTKKGSEEVKKDKSKTKTEDADDTESDKDEDQDSDGCEIMEDGDEKPELSDMEAESDNEKESNSEEDDDTEDDETDEDESMDDEEIKTESQDKAVKSEEQNDKKPGQQQNKKKVKSNDITEGKTVFLRNVPFHIDNNRLKQVMIAEFGYSTIMYALVCIDPLTEHSKGTAFIKFKTEEQAQACISKGSLLIDGETVTCHAAMDKKQLEAQKEDKDKKFKDSRNLYLVKEGVVTGGSRAAADVSVADMTKRVQLEQWKTQMLRNLHMFVSKTRLIVHNLPPDWSDAMLRAMFKKHSPPKAVIREAKVMRNIRDVDENGIAKSKEHGFVSYTTHEDTLAALRNVNNNPTIFTRAKRPIVAFSIENRAILNAKMNRTERSKEKNPLYREKYLAEKKQTMKQGGKGKQDKQKYSVKETKQRPRNQGDEEQQEFKGQVAAPTQNVSFAKKHKLAKQLEVHRGQLNKSKKEMRQKKRKNMVKAKTKDPVKTKPNMAKKKLSDDSNFNKLISSYKSKISSAANASNASGVKRWYDK